MRCSLALVLLASSATAVAAEPHPTLPAASFSYDAHAPLELRDEAPADTKGDVTVRDVSFASATSGERTRAYLVLPRGAGAHPGVLWVHWLGNPETTNRTEFLADARELARDGAVSLLVDAQWAAPKWFKTRTTDGDHDASIRQVKDLRRALDVLVAQPGVDAKRVALVGHDFGGMYGSIVAGVDERPRWLVIMAVTTKLSDWFLLGAPPKDKAAFVAGMTPLEPTHYLERSHVAACLFQFAKTDEYVTHEHAEEYAASAPGAKKVVYYDADHGLDVPSAHADRLAFLREKLAK